MPGGIAELQGHKFIKLPLKWKQNNNKKKEKERQAVIIYVLVLKRSTWAVPF